MSATSPPHQGHVLLHDKQMPEWIASPEHRCDSQWLGAAQGSPSALHAAHMGFGSLSSDVQNSPGRHVWLLQGTPTSLRRTQTPLLHIASAPAHGITGEQDSPRAGSSWQAPKLLQYRLPLHRSSHGSPGWEFLRQSPGAEFVIDRPIHVVSPPHWRIVVQVAPSGNRGLQRCISSSHHASKSQSSALAHALLMSPLRQVASHRNPGSHDANKSHRSPSLNLG